MKIKLNSDDSLPLNEPLKFHNITITARSVFEEDGKLYPQVFFRWCLIWTKHIKNARIRQNWYFRRDWCW